MKDNRFIKLAKESKLIRFLDYFLKIVGVAVLILVLAEVYFYINPIKSSNTFTESNQIEDWEDSGYRYHPYLNYLIDIEKMGKKKVHLCNEEDPEFKIYFYGGSTSVDGEVPVPTAVANNLCKEGYSVEVVNFGQTGYVSTQEMFKLMLHLQQGRRPDMVVFYNGSNDSWSDGPGSVDRDETKTILNHYLYNDRNYLSNTMNSIQTLLFNHNISKEDYDNYRILDSIDSFNYFNQHYLQTWHYENREEKYQDIIDAYFFNVNAVHSLGDFYNFDVLFYWQPNIATKDNLTDDERNLAYGERYEMFEHHQEFNKHITPELRDQERVTSLLDIFEGEKREIYKTDVHKTELGYQIVADFITDDIKETIKNNE